MSLVSRSPKPDSTPVALICNRFLIIYDYNLAAEHWKAVVELVKPEIKWDSICPFKAKLRLFCCQMEDEVGILLLFKVSEISDILPSSVDLIKQFAGNCLCIS